MRRNHVLVRAACGAAVAGGLLAAAVPASADQGPVGLSVQAPALIGGAGQPLPLTETVTNRGATPEDVRLDLHAVLKGTVEPDAFVIQYRATASGPWQDLPMTYGGAGNSDFHGVLPQTVTVPAGGRQTLALRIGLPMGRPHNGDSNGGASAVTLTSGVLAAGPGGAKLVEDVHRITVGWISNAVTAQPDHAVAGGPPVQVAVTLRNPTPSAYADLGNVLFTSPHAKVTYRAANGDWRTAPPVATDSPYQASHYLGGRNTSAAPDSTTTTPVRISYPADTPVGRSVLRTCVFVNEGSTPMRGTTLCGKESEMPIKAPAAPGSGTSPSAPVSPSAPASATAPAGAPSSPAPSTTSPAPGALAATGTSHTAPLAAITGGALLVAGGGAVWFARRRRTD